MDLSYHSRNAVNAVRNRSRIQRSGVSCSGQKLWTADEDEIIRSLYPKYVEIMKRLPHRTYRACLTRARKLKVVDERPPYTMRELSVVRRLYPAGEREEILSLLPGRTWQQIGDLAGRHGISRLPKSFTPTGVLVLDQIRARCRELNYTMPDLDKMIRGKGYFGKANWYAGHIHYRDIGRAVNVLYGNLRVDWK